MIRVRVGGQFTIKLLIRRPGEGSYVNGIWVEGTPIDQSFSVSWQPISPSEYRLLPEGESPKGVFSAYWNGKFNFGEEGKQNSDRIFADGKEYKLVGYQDWHHGGYSIGLFREIK